MQNPPMMDDVDLRIVPEEAGNLRLTLAVTVEYPVTVPATDFGANMVAHQAITGLANELRARALALEEALRLDQETR